MSHTDAELLRRLADEIEIADVEVFEIAPELVEDGVERDTEGRDWQRYRWTGLRTVELVYRVEQQREGGMSGTRH
jgi:ABC-type antimicrobial peptide transport system ATPase subunit